MMARMINDVLASLPEARVRAVDFGESLAPHVDVMRGRHLRFSIEDTRTINIWDYPGLEHGEMPNETEIALIVIDAMKLARVKPDDNIAEDILTNVVTEVFKNEVPRNGADRPRHEPTHSHLLAMLETYPFQSQAVETARRRWRWRSKSTETTRGLMRRPTRTLQLIRHTMFTNSIRWTPFPRTCARRWQIEWRRASFVLSVNSKLTARARRRC
jgi:hypothetical protein